MILGEPKIVNTAQDIAGKAWPWPKGKKGRLVTPTSWSFLQKYPQLRPTFDEKGVVAGGVCV